jgi:hypothetical protein
MTRGRDPTKVLADAIGDLRVVGVVFAFAGSLLLGLHVVTRFGPLSADVFTIIWVFCNTIVLVGPGVWYVVAASLLKRGQFWAATFSMRVAAGRDSRWCCCSFLVLSARRLLCPRVCWSSSCRQCWRCWCI